MSVILQSLAVLILPSGVLGSSSVTFDKIQMLGSSQSVICKLSLSFMDIHNIYKQKFPNYSSVDPNNMRIDDSVLLSILSNVVSTKKRSYNFLVNSREHCVEHLDLSGNLITEITDTTFSGFKDLRILNLSMNPIKTIHPKAFSQNTKLEFIDLSGHIAEDKANLIKQLNVLEVNHIVTVYLDTDINYGTHKFYLAPISEKITKLSSQHQPRVNLETINKLTYRIYNEYAENKKTLNQVESDLLAADLAYYEIHRNSETDSNTKSNISYLRYKLWAANFLLSRLSLNIVAINNINRGTYLNYDKLTFSEFLQDKNLMRINDSEFILIKDMFHSKLKELDFIGNLITKITKDTFSGLKELKVLNLSYNPINSIDPDAFKNNPKLEKLYLTGNEITKYNAATFRGLTELKTLNLSSNPKYIFDQNAFKDNANLKELDLSYNEITEIKADTFSGLRGLETLDLSYNQIKSIHPDAFKNHPKLNYIYFTGNKGTLSKEQLAQLNFNSKRRLITIHLPTKYESILLHQPDESTKKWEIWK